MNVDLSEKIGTILEQIVERREERKAELLKIQETGQQEESPKERRRTREKYRSIM